MEMQSRSWKREFVSLPTSNSTWICALIFPARLPSVSPGLEEELDQAEGGVLSTLFPQLPSLGPREALGSPRLCRPASPAPGHPHPQDVTITPFAAQSCLSLPASHPGSVLQSRESSAPSLPEDEEQAAHSQGALPGRHRQEGTQPP